MTIDERCLGSGGCVEYPRLRGRIGPQPQLAASSPNSIWIGGNGELLHWDDSGLHTEVDTDSGSPFKDLSDRCGEVMARTADGRIVRRVGPGDWIDDHLPEPAQRLAFSGGDTWALGSSGVWHRDASEWTLALADPTAVRIVASTTDKVWVAAAAGTLYFDGAVWTLQSDVAFPVGAGLAPVDGSELWVVSPTTGVLTVVRHSSTGREELEITVSPNSLDPVSIIGTTADDITVFFRNLRFEFDGLDHFESFIGATTLGVVTAGEARIAIDAAPGTVDVKRTVGVETSSLFALIGAEPSDAPSTTGPWGVSPTKLWHRDAGAWTVVDFTGPSVRNLIVDAAGLPWWIDGGELVHRDASGTRTSHGPAALACARPNGQIVAAIDGSFRVFASDGTVVSQMAVPEGIDLSIEMACPDDTEVWTGLFSSDAAGAASHAWSNGNRAIAVAPDDIWSVHPGLPFQTVSHRFGGLVRTFELGVPLLDVAASGETNVWVVGMQGTAFHWNGTVFVGHPTGSNDTLVSVQPVTPADVTAVTNTGEVLHWNGSTWSRTGTPLDPQGAIFDAVIVSTSEGYAVGIDAVGTRLFTFNGTSWTPSTITTTQRGSVLTSELFYRSPTDMWFFDHTTVFRLAGAVWTQQTGIPNEPGFPLTAFTLTATDAYVWNSLGQVLRDTGANQWAEVAAIPSNANVATLVSIGGGELFAHDVTPFRIGATTYEVDQIQGLREVRRTSDGTLHIVDGTGEIWKDAGNHRFVPAATVRVGDVFAARLISETNVWALANSKLFHFDGATWGVSLTPLIVARSLDLEGETIRVSGDSSVIRFGP